MAFGFADTMLIGHQNVAYNHSENLLWLGQEQRKLDMVPSWLL